MISQAEDSDFERNANERNVQRLLLQDSVDWEKKENSLKRSGSSDLVKDKSADPILTTGIMKSLNSRRADMGTYIAMGQNSKQVSSKTQGRHTAANTQLGTHAHTHTPRPSASGHTLGSVLCRSFYIRTGLQLCPALQQGQTNRHACTHTDTNTYLHTVTQRRDGQRQLYFFLCQLSESLTTTLPTCSAPISDVTFDKNKKQTKKKRWGKDYECPTLCLAGSVECHYIKLHGYFVCGFLGILAVARREQMSWR